MNRVGHEGRGESVWLAWFLCHVVRQFADRSRAAAHLACAPGRRRRAAGARRCKARLDGAWFVRAFFDDGSPLGSHANAGVPDRPDRTGLDVLSAAASPQRQQMAMASAGRLLIERDHRGVRLLDPPLADAQPRRATSSLTHPGVRENSRSIHAGVWALMARAALGRRRRLARIPVVEPGAPAANPRLAAAYEIEPYAMAGDVYTQPPYVGRGGWSWYTGSAAWMHRAAVRILRAAGGERPRLRAAFRATGPRCGCTSARATPVHRLVATADAAIAAALAAGAKPPWAVREWLILADGASSAGRLVIQAAVASGAGRRSTPPSSSGEACQGMCAACARCVWRPTGRAGSVGPTSTTSFRREPDERSRIDRPSS